MALKVTTPKREFVIIKPNKKDNVVLPDPHPDLSLQEVINHYSSKYPQLSIATVSEPKMTDGKAVYSFTEVLGTKG